MKAVIGIGFRSGATVEHIDAAIRAAAATAGLEPAACRLAVPVDKADFAPLRAAVSRLGLPLDAVEEGALRLTQPHLFTCSIRVMDKRGIGSVAEACALAALGQGGRLIGPRTIAPEGTVTTAVAILGDQP